jgi:hypothetical protein
MMESASAMASGLEANSCQVPSSSGHIWGQREADVSTKKVGSKKAGEKNNKTIQVLREKTCPRYKALYKSDREV